MLITQDPLKIFDQAPESIANLLLERENPPRLSFTKKTYYYLRPFIPLKLRQFLQSKRTIQYQEDWYVTEKLLTEYVKYLGYEKFNFYKKNIWPDHKQAALVLTHDVETEEGFNYIPKVIELEKKHGFVSSWNIVPHLYPIKNHILELIKNAGHEIGIHGYNHDGKLYFSKKIFTKRSLYINEAIKKYNAIGFRNPAVHRNLLWQQDLDIAYDSSCFDVDPFQPMPGGTSSIWPFKVGKFIELPYTLPQDHVIWIQLQKQNNEIWEKKSDWLYKNNGMILIITHPDYIMLNDNYKKYEELLIYFKTLQNVWHTLPKDMATFWANRKNPIYSDSN